ncbi:MAG: Flp pilus assembly complex ATPase component TadA [Candidatus Omnitrophica bacterium]|nr:Flp pilus assembly complex ATPase component TadA [Candidatus Omnitrophota bacterium]
MERKELGQILLDRGVITLEQLEDALIRQAAEKKFLGEILVGSKVVTNEQILECLTEQKKADFVNLENFKGIKQDAVKLIPENIARKYNVLAIALENERLVVAMSDPADIMAIDTVRRMTNSRIKVVKAEESQIKQYLEKHYVESADLLKTASALKDMETAEESVDLNQLRVAAEDVPIVRFVNSLFIEAVGKRATDIHLEPQEEKISVRFRIDGVLQQFPPPPKASYAGIVSRLKILSNLDIGERRLPQDGRTKVKIGPSGIDIRISTLPTIYGEKVVMRILDRGSLVKTLDTLGFEPEDEKTFKEGLLKPYGMIIVTGPTSAGKTTTLYSGLNFINSPDKNIITIEDPVEYELNGINQVQIKPKIGLTFAEILKRMMRQDPDIIMVGEMRDLETAQIGIQAALTGHLVISTLHTNDTISTVSRLNYMGVPNYLIAEALHLAIAQRLVRRICKFCKHEDAEGAEVLKNMGIPLKAGRKIYKGTGCSNCNFTGYFGRIAIFEVLKVNVREIKKSILEGGREEALRELCAKEGFRSLKDAALKKVFDGITTVDEFLSKTVV